LWSVSVSIPSRMPLAAYRPLTAAGPLGSRIDAN
jgi:hypothetical protein